jgi:hypothetical protein
MFLVGHPNEHIVLVVYCSIRVGLVYVFFVILEQIQATSKNRLAPPWEPQLAGRHYDLFGQLYQAKHFVLRSYPPPKTSCPAFLDGNN